MQAEINTMKYRSLGRTGVQVSQLCLDCMTFGAATERKSAYPIIYRAIDAGINFFDSANAYGRGNSEEVFGQALKANRKRKNSIGNQGPFTNGG